MLVKCPKCGFDQPDDTYCAKCGIEMASFKPVSPPFWKTLVKSPLFSLLIFLGLGYAFYFYLQSAQTMSPWVDTSTAKTEGSAKPATRNTDQEVSAPPEKRESTETASAAPPPGSSSTGPNQGQDTANPSDFPKTPPQTSPSAPSGAESLNRIPERPNNFERDESVINSENAMLANDDGVRGPLSLEVRFVEVPITVVQQFLSEASENSGGDSGEMSYGIVTNSSQWLRNKSLIELDRFTKQIPGVKKKVQWFSGAQYPDSDSGFGLDFQVTLQERVGGRLIGEIVINRTIVDSSEGAPQANRKEFTAQFETTARSLIGIVGVMPRLSINTPEKDWLQNSLLKIYLSPQFINNETELLILLQFKSDSK